MKKLLLILSMASLLFVMGCSSTKVEDTNVLPSTSSEVVDWFGKNLNIEQSPSWLSQLVLGNSAPVIEQFDSVSKSDVVSYGIAYAKDLEVARVASRVNFNAQVAETLRTKVISEAAATLDEKNEQTAIANAATLAKVDVSGFEKVTEFWQKIETYNPELDTKEVNYIAYTIYKTDKENWKNTLVAFLKQVIPAIDAPESQKRMANSIQALWDETTKNEAMAEDAFKEEVHLKQAQAHAAEAEAKAAEADAHAREAEANKPSNASAWLDALSLAADVLL